MKRKFDTLRATLDEFAQQDDYPMLVLGCQSEGLAYVLQFFQALEQTLAGHLIVAFHQPFHEPGQWLDAIVESVRLQFEVLAAQRSERGEPPCPPLPLDLQDARCPAHQRLVSLLRTLVELLPDQRDYRVVVGLLPLACSDVEGFARLMATLAPQRPELPAGVTALRLVVWDDLERGCLRQALVASRNQHALGYVTDLSTPALTDALREDAANRQLPLGERMASLHQLAALDYAYKRYADALDKYAVLHEFHRARGQGELQALALLGAGDTLFAAGDPVTAKLRLQQGITAALACHSLPVLSNLLSSVTDVSAALGQHADAERYADAGTQVAAATLNPFVYADFHDKRGDAQVAQNKVGEGLASFTRARALCRLYGHFSRWYAVLDKQAALYHDAGMSQELRALEDERCEAQVLEREAAMATAKRRAM